MPPRNAGAEKLGEPPLVEGRKKPWAKPAILPIEFGVLKTSNGEQIDPSAENSAYAMT